MFPCPAKYMSVCLSYALSIQVRMPEKYVHRTGANSIRFAIEQGQLSNEYRIELYSFSMYNSVHYTICNFGSNCQLNFVLNCDDKKGWYAKTVIILVYLETKGIIADLAGLMLVLW